MKANQIPNITIYSKGYCPYCQMAKRTLDRLGLKFDEFDITNSASLEKEMRQRSQRRTVPQIFINDHHLGGNDDLQDALRSGEFKRLLNVATEAA